MKTINIKDIKKLIILAIVLIFGFIYISEIWSFIKFVIKIFMPFIIGLAIAFVLNVLMNSIETKWFGKWKVSTKVKRPISLLISIAIVLGFIVFLLFLIIPNLQNTISLFADSIPVYSRNLQELLNNWGINADIINDIIIIYKCEENSYEIEYYYCIDRNGNILLRSNGITLLDDIYIVINENNKMQLYQEDLTKISSEYDFIIY